MTKQLDLNGEIAGHSARLVRRLLRAASWRLVGAQSAASVLKVPVSRARLALHRLHALGYLEPASSKDTHRRGRWVATRLGVSLAAARGVPRMKRATADRLMAGVMERAAFLAGTGHEYAFCLGELLVFGSYLTDTPTLGDLDLAACWVPRFAEKDRQWAYLQARIDKALNAGRRFSNYTAELHWPLLEVQRYLRGRSGRISLQDLDENGDFVLAAPHRWLLRAGAHSSASKDDG